MPKKGQLKGTPARRAEFIEKLKVMGDGAFCVTWPWSDIAGGYARIHVEGVKVGAHRWVYEQIHGPLLRQEGPGATGTVVMHTCDNRACVRPSHLRLGSQDDNMKDAAIKGRMPGCRTGNPGGRKLSDEDVAAIRNLKQQGVRQSHIARAYGVSDATISLIIHNKGRRLR